jgi:hypothetical protein
MHYADRVTKSDSMGWWNRVAKPAVVAALVVANIWVLVWSLNTTGTALNSRTAALDNLAQEYGLTVSDAYLLSNGEGQ